VKQSSRSLFPPIVFRGLDLLLVREQFLGLNLSQKLSLGKFRATSGQELHASSDEYSSIVLPECRKEKGRQRRGVLSFARQPISWKTRRDGQRRAGTATRPPTKKGVEQRRLRQKKREVGWLALSKIAPPGRMEAQEKKKKRTNHAGQLLSQPPGNHRTNKCKAPEYANESTTHGGAVAIATSPPASMLHIPGTKGSNFFF
jgi:hypothetical protein